MIGPVDTKFGDICNNCEHCGGLNPVYSRPDRLESLCDHPLHKDGEGEKVSIPFVDGFAMTPTTCPEKLNAIR